MLWLTAALIVVACLIEIVGAIAKKRVSQLRKQEACREAFYRYADHLISDPETPEEVLRLINMMLSQVTSRTFCQRASQKPSRPASKATAIRVIVWPALTDSSRQRCSRASSRSELGSSFLRG